MSATFLGLFAVALLIGFAAFLALAETSLTHMGKAKTIALREEGHKGAGALARLLEHPERVLNPILLLVLLCHLVAATIVGVLVFDRWGSGAVVIAVVVEAAVIFVVGEAMPKTYALQKTERAAVFVAPFVGVLSRFGPLRWISRGLIGLSNIILPGKGRKSGPAVSEEELLAMADVAVESGSVETEEAALIESIIEFGDTVAREVMVPRPDMVTVPATATVSDAIEVVIAHGKSRVPVTGSGLDDVVGLVHAKDLMRAEREGHGDVAVTGMARPAKFVPETKPVSHLLREMQAERFHLAVLVDEYGGISGLVTMEDLIEELLGDIVDEYDTEAVDVEELPDGDYRVSAGLAIDELNDLLDTHVPDDDWDTVGGFVFGMLGHVPTGGEWIEYEGHRYTAEKVEGRRIALVRISAIPGWEPPPDEDED